MTVVGVIRPREAGIECIGNGCGGSRMCDRDRNGAGLGLGWGCEGSHALTVPLSIPQLPQSWPVPSPP